MTNSRAVEQLNNLPDLPGLESVGTGKHGATSPAQARLICLCSSLFMIGLAGYTAYEAYLTIKQLTKQGHTISRMGDYYFVCILAAAFILFIYLALRYLWTENYWLTDSKGIIAMSLFHQRLVEWSDIQDAETIYSSFLTVTFHKIRTSRGALSFAGGGEEGARFVAAVWQYLRRYGKAGNMELEEKVLSFWEPIPTEIPEEIDVEFTQTPARLRKAGYIALVILFTLPFILLWIYDRKPKGLYWLMNPVILIYLMPFITIIRRASNQAMRFSLRKDRFDALIGRGPISVPWSEVTRATRESDTILLETADPQTKVYVPAKSLDQQSAQLVMGIIRNLRRAGPPKYLTFDSRTLGEACPWIVNGL